MPVFHISYNLVYIERFHEVRNKLDGVFKSIFDGIGEENFCKIGDMEWLVDYTGESEKSPQEINEKLLDKIRDKLGVVKLVTADNKPLVLTLEHCTSQIVYKDTLVVHYADRDKQKDVEKWIGEHVKDWCSIYTLNLNS